MALLFVDSLTQNNNRFVQILVKALELMLLSAGLISTLAVGKRTVLPYSCEIVFTSLVGFWSSITCFLSSPLSVCFIINVMVVLIVVSSTFFRHETDYQDDEITLNVDDHDVQIFESFVASAAAPPPSPPGDVAEVTPTVPLSPRDITEVAAASPATPSSRIPTSSTTSSSSTLYQVGNHDVSSHDSTEQNRREKATLYPIAALLLEADEIKKLAYSLNSSPYSSELTNEETVTTTNLPPFPEEWKDVFVEGKEDKIMSNPSDDQGNEEEDTMDATWKAITGGGKQKPKNKHLKKSETWDVVPPRRSVAVQRLDSEEVLPTSPKWKELRKAETFNDAVSVTRRGGLTRDPSMSLEEFNHRVEAFIKKFNDNIRLERQKSKQRFLDMISQGH